MYLKQLEDISNYTKRVSEKLTMINDCMLKNNFELYPKGNEFLFGSLL